MSDFYTGDLALFIHISGPPSVLVEILGCEENTGPNSMCRIRILEARNSPHDPLALDSERDVPRFFLKPYQKPLRNVLNSKARQYAIRNSFERATGQYAGPASWANTVLKYSGNSFPRGAEGPWSNGRNRYWMRNPLSSIEGRRGWNYVPYDGGTRKRKSKGRKTRRGRRH
jgi:hypothetical protein